MEEKEKEKLNKELEQLLSWLEKESFRYYEEAHQRSGGTESGKIPIPTIWRFKGGGMAYQHVAVILKQILSGSPTDLAAVSLLDQDQDLNP